MIRKQKIKRANKSKNPEANKNKFTTIAEKLSGSGNTKIAAEGLLVKAANQTLDDSIVAKAKADDAAAAATVTMHTENDNVVDAVNDAATVVEKELPGDVAAWIDLGFDVTSGEAHDATLPEPAKNGKVVQFMIPGKGKLTFDALPNIKVYRLYETSGDPSVMANFTPANPDIIDKAETIVTPKKLGVKTWWIVIGHNSAGDGAPSQPFGAIIN